LNFYHKKKFSYSIPVAVLLGNSAVDPDPKLLAGTRYDPEKIIPDPGSSRSEMNLK
jgi:hypothetical protein